MIYCGVDGGGTKTKIVIAEEDRIITTITSTASSIDTVSIKDTKKVIEEALDEVYSKYKLPKIDSIFLGLGGIVSENDINEVKNVIKTITHLKEKAIIKCDNDMKNAYYASCSGRNNITLIIGTGSVAFGIDENNNQHRASGINFLEGDFGSGADMGKRALTKMSKAFDGRLEHTPLTLALLKKFKIKTFGDIVNFFVEQVIDRKFLASIAKLVMDFAKEGDKNAIAILDEATEEILQSIIAVDSKINLINREIGIIGGLGNNELYFKTLKNKVLNYDGRFRIHSAEMSAEVASLEMAKEQIG